MPRPSHPPWIGSTDFLSVVATQQQLYTDDQPPAGAKVKDVWICPVSLHGQAATHGASSPFRLFSRSAILFRYSLIQWLGFYLGLVSLFYS
jgi:hypothetical protein